MPPKSDQFDRLPADLDDVLEALRRRFDEQLAALQAPDVAARLQRMMDTPLALEGKIKAGTGY